MKFAGRSDSLPTYCFERHNNSALTNALQSARYLECRCQFLGKSTGGSPLGCEALVKTLTLPTVEICPSKYALKYGMSIEKHQPTLSYPTMQASYVLTTSLRSFQDVHSRPMRV